MIWALLVLGRPKNVSGGKAYDPSSGKNMCCEGTLYNLQVQDRLSEEAQCSGSVLMEVSSTQTCCSAPGQDLLYPTQPGFICRGHRYPNTTLWSCCVGVLHPRPESHTTSKNMIPDFGMTAPSTTECKVLLVIYGLLGCSATILFFNLFLEKIITMLGFLMRWCHQKRTHNIRLGGNNNQGGWERRVEALCVFGHSQTTSSCSWGYAVPTPSSMPSLSSSNGMHWILSQLIHLRSCLCHGRPLQCVSGCRTLSPP
eukprot:XP_014068923.1 PREDICTED: uncharacterized protein LOC106612371 [Salmo salar]